MSGYSARFRARERLPAPQNRTRKSANLAAFAVANCFSGRLLSLSRKPDHGCQYPFGDAPRKILAVVPRIQRQGTLVRGYCSTALNTWPGVYLGEACFIALWP